MVVLSLRDDVPGVPVPSERRVFAGALRLFELDPVVEEVALDLILPSRQITQLYGEPLVP